MTLKFGCRFLGSFFMVLLFFFPFSFSLSKRLLVIWKIKCPQKKSQDECGTQLLCFSSLKDHRPSSSASTGCPAMFSPVDLNIRLAYFGVFPSDSVGKESCNVGDLSLIPESGRSSGEGNGNPLQYSCLENFRDREAQQAKIGRAHV